MKLPHLEEMNSPRFLEEVFEKEPRLTWLKSARIRRNVYMWLFVAGMVCMLYTAVLDRMTLSILSLFLAVVSLVVMSKYETQLCFLNILEKRDAQQNQEPDHS